MSAVVTPWLPEWPTQSARVLLSVAAVTAMSVSGCPRTAAIPPGGTIAALTTDNPRAEADLRRAQQAYAAGDTDLAQQRFASFLTQYPQDPLNAAARLALARLALDRAEPSEALTHLTAVRAHREPSVREQAQLLAGVAYEQIGDPERAVSLLEPLRGTVVGDQDSALLLRSLSGAALRLGDEAKALAALDAWLRLAPADPSAREALGQALGRVSAAGMDSAAQTLGHDGVVWRQTAMQALRNAFERGELERVAQLAAALRTEHVELGADLDAMILRAERRESTDSGAIGLIVPLTGRGRQVGEQALRGALLAAGRPEPNPPGTPPATRIVFRDYRGDPAASARAVEDLVAVHRVIAIVGPLDAGAATQAATRAQELGVPLLSLSPSGPPDESATNAFFLFARPENELLALVNAAQSRGARRFAAIVPSTPYGTTVLSALREVLTRASGELSTVAEVDPAATTFTDPAEQVANAAPDAVLLALSPRTVALVAPALAAAGLWSVLPDHAPPRGAHASILLVPAPGFDPSLAQTTDRYLQGALFSAPFYAPLSSRTGRDFAVAYTQHYGEPPGAFAAYAYDAVRLVLATTAAGAATRAEVSTRLPAAGIETAGASSGVGPSGAAREATRILMLKEHLFEAASANAP